MLILFCVGKLTNWSLMSNVVILCWSLIWMLLSSCATILDFCGSMCVCGKFINLLSFFIKMFGKFIRWCLYILPV